MTMSYVHTAHLVLKLQYVDRFKERIRRHAMTSLADEEGCLVFRTLQDRDDPTRFMMFEVYADQAADKAHRNSPHFKELRAEIDDWVVGREWWFWEEFPES